MDLGRPHRSVVNTLDGDVLVLLAGIARPLTGGEIAARLPLASREGVRRSLERLVVQGTVLRQRAGNAYLHTLNREHLAAPAVEALAQIRPRLWAALRAALDAWDVRPAHASAFGSAARGEGHSDSDIDLFLVRPVDVPAEDARWREQVATLVAGVRAWTGNDLRVVEQDQIELAALLRHDPPVLRDLRRDGVDLAGTPIRMLEEIARDT